MDYINFLKSGSGIHIKKANKGKFTDYCGGKVTSECIARGKKSPSATIRKRATFAANARTWKHQTGGRVFFNAKEVYPFGSPIIDPRKEESEEIKEKTTEESTTSQSNTNWIEQMISSLTSSKPTVSSASQTTETTHPQQTSSAQSQQSTSKTGPRGYRNNNPLNIRISNNPWQGKISDNTDGSFEQFVDMAHGYRAGFINMRTQINRGNNTIRKLINIWAPASDSNNPENYAKFVSSTSGIPIDAVIDPNDAASMQKIVSAMARMENGKDANAEDIAQGWKLYTGIA